MHRTFYRSEGMVNERASDVDARHNFMNIAANLDEAEILLSASRNYVTASQNRLENLKKYLCIVEADIRSSAEGITEVGTRLQKMRSELQCLFQSVFHQDSGHHEENDRNAQNVQTTSSVSKRVLDTIREFAIDMSIDLDDYTVTWDEHVGVTFVILHPKNKPNDSFDQESDSFGKWTTNQEYESESCLDNSSTTGRTVNTKFMNVKNSGNVYRISEGAECRNRQEATNMLTASAFIQKIMDGSQPTDTAREIHQRDNDDPLPFSELRQRSIQKVNRKIIPYFPVSVNDASSSVRPIQGKYSSIGNLPIEPDISSDGPFRPSNSCVQMNSITDEHKRRNFTQTGSKLDEADSRALTKSNEFTASEKTYVYERSSRKPNRSQREDMHASKHKSSSQMKSSEKASENTNLFVAYKHQREDSARTSRNFNDFIQNKENELSAFNQPGIDEEQRQKRLPHRSLNKQIVVRPLWPMGVEKESALWNTHHFSSKPEEQSLDQAENSSGCLPEGNWTSASLDNSKGKENRSGVYSINMPENWEKSFKISKDLSENESVSCSARRTSSSNETIPPFMKQNRLQVSFTNPRKPVSKSSQARTKKAIFSRKSTISLIGKTVRNCFPDKKEEKGLCDSGNNFDNVLTDKRVPPNAPLETTKKLTDDIEKNASNNSTFEMASDDFLKTVVSLDTNMEYDSVASRSISSGSYRNGLTTTKNPLRSNASQEKKYSSYEKEIPGIRPFTLPRETSEIKKPESRSSFGNEASNENSSRAYDEMSEFRRCRQEQLKFIKKLVTRAAACRDNISFKSSSYLPCKDLSGLEDTKVLTEKFSDSSSVSDNASFDDNTESEYLNASNRLDESDCRSKYESATDMNYASVSAENTKSERFHDVSSSFCSNSSTAVNHSPSSLTPKGSACQLPDPISRGEKLPRKKPLSVNSSFLACTIENISKTSTLTPPFTLKCSSAPVSDSSSSPEKSP